MGFHVVVCCIRKDREHFVKRTRNPSPLDVKETEPYDKFSSVVLPQWYLLHLNSEYSGLKSGVVVYSCKFNKKRLLCPSKSLYYATHPLKSLIHCNAGRQYG